MYLCSARSQIKCATQDANGEDNVNNMNQEVNLATDSSTNPIIKSKLKIKKVSASGSSTKSKNTRIPVYSCFDDYHIYHGFSMIGEQKQIYQD